MNIELRGHHLRPLQYYLHTGEVFTDEYSPEFRDKVLELYARMQSGTDMNITLTTTLDYFCDGCTRKTEKCEWFERDDDFFAWFFDLELGETHSAKKIIDQLREKDLY
ncbi:DUF1284 domain-containing protein [archaeon]|jgi:hypothetical protein|nr:DUF1284 domain-containing protein [archaeon]MBT4397387.1 DUF1284 domain-containing protein [archaeon]MBT4440767.1 DUF1284 domain-containing protein [archaeon]